VLSENLLYASQPELVATGVFNLKQAVCHQEEEVAGSAIHPVTREGLTVKHSQGQIGASDLGALLSARVKVQNAGVGCG